LKSPFRGFEASENKWMNWLYMDYMALTQRDDPKKMIDPRKNDTSFIKLADKAVIQNSSISDPWDDPVITVGPGAAERQSQSHCHALTPKAPH